MAQLALGVVWAALCLVCVYVLYASKLAAGFVQKLHVHFRIPNSYPRLGAYALFGILRLRHVGDS